MKRSVKEEKKGRMFSHLSMHKRLKIEKMDREKYSIQEIADAVGVHYTTVWRELRRGRAKQMTTDLVEHEVYCADVAERKYRENLAAKGPDLKIANDRELADYLENLMLNEKYSPGAALAKIKEEGRVFSVEISEWTLYSYITKGVFRTLTNKDLPMRGEKKQEYKKVQPARAPAGDSIEDRDPAVETREVFGDWEMDTVESAKNKKKKGAGKKARRPKEAKRLLVLTERKSRRELLCMMPNGKTESVVRALDQLERKIGTDAFRRIFRSITVDNGSEFANCEGLQRSCLGEGQRTRLYYCHPYSSWERGSNENCNRMVRRWWPKGTDFSTISVKAVRAVQKWINEYPRKILGWKSASKVFNEHLAELGLEGVLSCS